MVNEQLRGLIEQAGRNLETLELLTRSCEPSGVDRATVASYRTRLQDLQHAYRRETNGLTLIALQQAVERRYGPDRRRVADRRRDRES